MLATLTTMDRWANEMMNAINDNEGRRRGVPFGCATCSTTAPEIP